MNLDLSRILKSAPVILGALAAVVTTVIAQAEANGWAEVAQYGGVVATWLATALAVVRVVQPVAAGDRGLPRR